MKVHAVSNRINFKRNLTPSELKEYSDVLKEGKTLAGQTDKSIFIMPSSCLPQTKEFNSGIGHLASEISQNYIEYMKNYLGINVVEDLPSGQVWTHRTPLYCAYNSSALALGNHQINPELLATSEFENILTKEDLQEIVNGNNNPKKETIADFKNVMDNDGTQNKVLKRAFKKFQQLDEKSALKQKFNKYTEENASWLNFERAEEPSLDFFKFKQFLADEHLKLAKDKLNKKGIKLCGDSLIGFSKDEIRAFPDAFMQNGYVGEPYWGKRALNYDKILDENSVASKLLKQKVQLCAKRYDLIRFDVGWAYVTPYVTENGKARKIQLGDALLKRIEQWVKEVKGQDFDVRKNLIYEFEADWEKFEAFNSSGQLIEPLRNRVKVYGSTYMHNSGGDAWGYNKAFLDRGWSPDEYVLGVGNHDPQPLKQIAKGIKEQVQNGDGTIREEAHKEPAIKPLSEILNIPEKELENPTTFAKAKWAEPMMSKNNMMFYMDVFGREERFDMQFLNMKMHPELNYAYKVPTDYKTAYQQGIQEGFGFNPMDALEKVFKAKGLDKTHPELYKKIIKFNKILQDSKEIVEESKPKSKFLKPVLIGFGVVSAGLMALYYAKQYTEKNRSVTS